uniref:Expressed protein n=1 Tax=Echinococcus granulosus TaxID=6210 RepID=A0A068WSU9_ECHGR|nr:expressed protein [Echinococcus granulosus]
MSVCGLFFSLFCDLLLMSPIWCVYTYVFFYGQISLPFFRWAHFPSLSFCLPFFTCNLLVNKNAYKYTGDRVDESPPCLFSIWWRNIGEVENADASGNWAKAPISESDDIPPVLVTMYIGIAGAESGGEMGVDAAVIRQQPILLPLDGGSTTPVQLVDSTSLECRHYLTPRLSSPLLCPGGGAFAIQSCFRNAKC